MNLSKISSGIGLVALGTVISFTSCQKDDVDSSLRFQMSSEVGTVNQKISAANTLQFTSGHVIIREIVFDGDRKGQEDVSITHEQISQIDLVTGIGSPEVNVQIPPGEYTSVNMGIEILDDDDIHPLAVLCEGTYYDANNTAVPVRFEFNSGEVFEANTNGSTVKIKSATSPLVKISFDPLVWFSTITRSQLDNAQRDSNGVIVVSSSMNTNIFSIVADKLDDATQATFQ